MSILVIFYSHNDDPAKASHASKLFYETYDPDRASQALFYEEMTEKMD